MVKINPIKNTYYSPRIAVKEQYSSTPQAIGYQTQQPFNFVTAMKEGDYVIPSNVEKVLGIGKIVGEYFYVTDPEAPHRRPVEWLSLEEWKIHDKEGLQTTVYELKKADNLIEIEKNLFKQITNGRENEVIVRIQSNLERKGQVIVYGPPGTGKTYCAEKAAKQLASQPWHLS